MLPCEIFAFKDRHIDSSAAVYSHSTKYWP